MRVPLALVALLLLPTALAASGAFTFGDTWASAHHYVVGHLPPGKRVEATLTWSNGDLLEMYASFRCPATPPLGLAPPERYAEYATHEALGCRGWGTGVLEGSPARMSFTTPFQAFYEIHVRDVAATGFTFYTLDVQVDGANVGVHKQSTTSAGAGWMSCNLGHEGP